MCCYPGQGRKSCLTDVDECNAPEGGHGFTLSLWVKLNVPFTGYQAQNIIQFGHGRDQEFGFTVSGINCLFVMLLLNLECDRLCF